MIHPPAPVTQALLHWTVARLHTKHGSMRDDSSGLNEQWCLCYYCHYNFIRSNAAHRQRIASAMHITPQACIAWRTGVDWIRRRSYWKSMMPLRSRQSAVCASLDLSRSLAPASARNLFIHILNTTATWHKFAFGWVPNQPRLDLHLNAIQMLQIFGKDLR